MNRFTQKQIELQFEMATLSNCRIQLRDLWLNNFSPELLTAMDSILDRLRISEKELDSTILAREIEESLEAQSLVPVVSLRLKI